MASVCYVHSASFLDELNHCAADFKAYMHSLAQSIKLAATEIALGIVHRRTEALSHQTGMDESLGTSTPKTGTLKREGTRGSLRASKSRFVVFLYFYGSTLLKIV